MNNYVPIFICSLFRYIICQKKKQIAIKGSNQITLTKLLLPKPNSYRIIRKD